MENLTKEEIEFVIDALQQRWVDAVKQLQFGKLGDIEKRNYEFAKTKSKELMIKLGYQY